MKVKDYDEWLENFELDLYDAAVRARVARIEKSPICTGCKHRDRTYSFLSCKDCEPTGTMFEAAEEGGGDE